MLRPRHAMTDFLLAGLFLLALLGCAVLVFALARSNRDLVRLHLTKDHAYRQGLDATNRWIFEALRVHNKELYSLVGSDLGRQVIERHGMLPFTSDPASRVQNEIRTVMVNLGCDRAEAIEFIRASIRNVTQSANTPAGRMTEALHGDPEA